MIFNNFPTVVLGVAVIASLGGCCTSGSCGSGSCSSGQVYSAPSVEQAPASDCGCGCSATADSTMSYESSDVIVSGDSTVPSETFTVSPGQSIMGEATSSVPSSPVSPVVEPPTLGGTPGFTAESAASKAANALPGNLLPGE